MFDEDKKQQTQAISDPTAANAQIQKVPAPHRDGAGPAQKRASSQGYNALKTGSVSVVDLISPPSVEVDFKNIRVGDKFFRTFFVVDYPRQVSPNWLSILQMEDGFRTTLPAGVDKLFITRNMDTTSLASTFPFTSYEISHPNGILYGVNTINNSLAIVDRFSFENANEVVFGKSGSGKSFLVKLEILRQMMFDAEILIIDPEDEYRTLCHALDGEYINFSKNSEVKINPFALLADDLTEAQLGIKILSLHGLLKTMLGEMSPTQEAILDRAIVLSYKQKGITPDPVTFKNEQPILEDLYKTLLNMEEVESKDLSFRLEKYVKGGFSV